MAESRSAICGRLSLVFMCEDAHFAAKVGRIGTCRIEKSDEQQSGNKLPESQPTSEQGIGVAPKNPSLTFRVVISDLS